MGRVRKTITLTDQQGAWVKARIARGGFTNDSEYIRDLIPRDQERSAEIEAIRRALIEGENSGISERTPDEIVRAAKESLKADGRI
ncbi:type II toxin-antitoxin system ParD family antitoxin [Thiorhodococcus minor]|uniref:Antitoxin ParD n=1 Tax=Thiorhodococcus minor TaxID=57489 RepID=A0A6M0K096_9GAMM|nr:type II toxin-antitoxin system ParD family antitoxin [Thiorhodococcus minor]NEV62761.1 type II toxin-antitoxin system ParD family antitoxin [Thiorhodococcus minor]